MVSQQRLEWFRSNGLGWRPNIKFRQQSHPSTPVAQNAISAQCQRGFIGGGPIGLELVMAIGFLPAMPNETKGFSCGEAICGRLTDVNRAASGLTTRTNKAAPEHDAL